MRMLLDLIVMVGLLAAVVTADKMTDTRFAQLEKELAQVKQHLEKMEQTILNAAIERTSVDRAGKINHYVIKRQSIVDGIDPVRSNDLQCECVDGTAGRDGIPGSPGIPGHSGAHGTPGLTGAKGESGEQGPSGQKGEMGYTGSKGSKGVRGLPGPVASQPALPAPYHNIWRQGNIESFLKVTNLRAMTQMTACFYFKPSHIGHAGAVTFHQRVLMSITSDSNDNEFMLAFHGHHSQDLRLAGEPQTNTVTYGLEAAFSEAHRHCFVWNDGSYLKWFYDSDTPGVLELAGQVADSGNSRIPGGSTLVLLNEQDSKGGSLDTRQMIAGDIADFQMWDRAFANSQVRALGCREVGNVVTYDDMIPVGVSHFHRDSTFQCSNIN